MDRKNAQICSLNFTIAIIEIGLRARIEATVSMEGHTCLKVHDTKPPVLNIKVKCTKLISTRCKPRQCTNQTTVSKTIYLFLNGNTRPLFSLFFVLSTQFTESAEFKLGSSEKEACGLTTWPLHIVLINNIEVWQLVLRLLPTLKGPVSIPVNGIYFIPSTG